MSAIHSQHYRTVVEMLVAARKNAGMTQKEVAAIWGKGQPTIVAIESGERRLDVAEFIELCDILSINPNDIVTAAHSVLKKNFYKKLDR